MSIRRIIQKALRVYNAYDGDAKSEGWAVFTRDDGRLYIQTMDDPIAEEGVLVWDNDADAIAFVGLRARDGSLVHQAALTLHGQLP